MITKEITSKNNPDYKLWLKLVDAKGIKKFNQAIFTGKKTVHEALDIFPEKIVCVLVKKAEDAIKFRKKLNTPIFLLSKELFDSLDIYGTNEPIIIIKAEPLPLWEKKLSKGITLFLPFQNPINLGTTIRTAAALNAEVVVLQEAANPFLPKSLRASGPAIFQTPIYQGPSITTLPEYANLPLYAMAADGNDINRFSFPKTFGLLAGLEGPGLNCSWPFEQTISIPMKEGVESLNAAIAISIALGFNLRQA